MKNGIKVALGVLGLCIASAALCGWLQLPPEWSVASGLCVGLFGTLGLMVIWPLT
jgi:hypothetical protein